jgi:hypothetical protein
VQPDACGSSRAAEDGGDGGVVETLPGDETEHFPVIVRSSVVRSRRRDSPRQGFASTRRATPYSQSRALAPAGMSSNRLQATVNVSATMSAASSGEEQRRNA